MLSQPRHNQKDKGQIITYINTLLRGTCHVHIWFTLWYCSTLLIHWGQVTHIYVNKRTIIVSENGLSPGRRQAIIWINDGILSIRTIGTYFSEMLIGISTFSLKKLHLKISSARWRPGVLSRPQCFNTRCWEEECNAWLILGLRPANERRRYKVTPSLIGWGRTQNQQCNGHRDDKLASRAWLPISYHDQLVGYHRVS